MAQQQIVTKKTGEQQLVITRLFYAPRYIVWRAWTRREQFARWYGGANSTLSDVHMNVRPGGGWSAVMHVPDAPDIPWKADYREVVEPERLVFALRNPQNHDDPKVELVTVTLEDLGGRTRMIFRQLGNLPPEEYRTGLKQGWNSFFDRMDELVLQDAGKPPPAAKSALKLGMVMIGTARPQVLADFYEKVLGRPADFIDDGWYGWQFEGVSLAIGEHSEVKGAAADPQRVILNLEAEDVKKEYQRIKATDAVIVKDLYQIEGAWIATFADPDGNYFQVVSRWEDVKK